jgi:hypothetical protein
MTADVLTAEWRHDLPEYMTLSLDGVVTVAPEITHRLPGPVVLTMPDFTADNLGRVLARAWRVAQVMAICRSERRNVHWPRRWSPPPKPAATAVRLAGSPYHPASGSPHAAARPLARPVASCARRGVSRGHWAVSAHRPVSLRTRPSDPGASR